MALGDTLKNYVVGVGIRDNNFTAGLKNMGGQLRLIHLRCDRRADNGRTVPVPHIILYHEHRPYPALF